MALFEDTPQPGAPYLMAAVISFWAFLHSFELPVDPDVAHAKQNAQRTGAEDGAGLLDASDIEDEYL